MFEINRTKKNLKLQSQEMEGVAAMEEELKQQESVNSKISGKEKLSPSRIATLRYDDRTLPEEIITQVCRLYALGNMRLNEIVKRINSTIIRSGKYGNLRPLTLPDVYGILYQEKKKPKYTTGKFNVLNSGFTNELSILQFITFFTKWTYGGRFDECYQEMMEKVTSRNNPSRSFCHNTFKLLNRLFRQHKNRGGKKIKNRAYKTLFNDVFTKMRFVTINEMPALVIFFKDISHDAVNDIMNQIPGFGDVMKAYLEGQYEIDVEIEQKQLKLGNSVSDAIKRAAEQRGISEEVIVGRFHGDKEHQPKSKLLDPDLETGYAASNLNIPVQANDNILYENDSSNKNEDEIIEEINETVSMLKDEEINETLLESPSESREKELEEEDLNILEQIENADSENK